LTIQFDLIHTCAVILGNVPIQELSAEQIQSFYALKANGGASQHVLQLINNLLHYALEDTAHSGLVLVNPVKGTLKIQRSYQERSVLSPSQAQQGNRRLSWDTLGSAYLPGLDNGDAGGGDHGIELGGHSMGAGTVVNPALIVSLTMQRAGFKLSQNRQM